MEKKRAFDTIASLYDAVYSDKNYYGESREILAGIKSHSRILRSLIDFNHNLVDIGCGTGKTANIFQNEGYYVIGIEPSRAMADIADSRLVCNIINKPIQKLTTSNIPDAVAEVVLATFDVLDYIITMEDFFAAIKVINHMLKEGGIFFYEGWNAENMKKVFEPSRIKPFNHNGKQWVRTSRTSYDRKKQVFTVRYSYTDGSKVITEAHRLCPRLSLLTIPEICREFGFEMAQIVCDAYTVKTWFRKVRTI